MTVVFRLVDGVEWVSFSFDLNEISRVATADDRERYSSQYAALKPAPVVKPTPAPSVPPSTPEPELELKPQPFFSKKKTK